MNGARLKGKVAVVIGAGQTPGQTVGNGKAVAIRFAQEGATVVAVDLVAHRAEGTAAVIRSQGGICEPFAADVLVESSLVSLMASVARKHGRIDILHNNVGASGALGDKSIELISPSEFDVVQSVNLRGMAMACKHALPFMKRQNGGVILNVGSAAALAVMNDNIAYKTSKAGVIALTQQIAVRYASCGIRANCIMPGLLDTPMAIETRAKGDPRLRDALRAERDALVPLRRKMGTAWDVANAALFLASDEANFITGVSLPVDGGCLARVGM